MVDVGVTALASEVDSVALVVRVEDPALLVDCEALVEEPVTDDCVDSLVD